MMPRVRIVLCLLAISMLFVGCGPAAPGPQAVFLIVVDTLRPDRLSAYGCEDYETPNVDALAARGIRFARARTVASWTVPSMGAMLTSRYPAELGLVEAPVEPGRPFKRREQRDQVALQPPLAATTLAEQLRDAGLRTAAFVNQPGLSSGRGFMQGFEEWYHPGDNDSIVRHDPLDEVKTYPWAHQLVAADEVDNALVDRFEEWLARRSRERVFVWLHLLTPHAPYDPPSDQVQRYARSSVLSRDLSLMERRMLNQRALYDAEVRMVDRTVGRILAAIEREMGIERSLIVFTSDHGEEFGEHESFGHGHSLYKEVIQVPLIMAGYRMSPVGVVDESVRVTDIMPTILAAFELPPTAPLVGESLLPVIEGTGHVTDMLYAGGMYFGYTQRALVAGDYKLIVTPDRGISEFYHLADDPGEKKPVRAGDTERLERMRTALEQMHTRTTRNAFDHPVQSDAERERALEALRSLGYINQ